MDASWSEALRRDRETAAARAEQVTGRHANPIEFDLVVTAIDAKHGQFTDDAIARRIGRNDDQAERRVVRCIGFGPAHHRRVTRIGGARREPLVARSEEHTSELQSLMRISYD